MIIQRNAMVSEESSPKEVVDVEVMYPLHYSVMINKKYIHIWTSNFVCVPSMKFIKGMHNMEVISVCLFPCFTLQTNSSISMGFNR